LGREATVTGKGDRQRTVRFTYDTARALDRYLRERAQHPMARVSALWLGVRGGPMTASGVYQMIEQCSREAGVDVNPHKFRHTFSHYRLDNGGVEGDLLARPHRLVAPDNLLVLHVDCTQVRGLDQGDAVSLHNETPPPDDGYVTVVGVIATTHAIPGRTVRLTLEALEHAREQLLAGAVPNRVEHDSRRAIDSEFTDVEIRKGDDGEFSLVATMVMSELEFQRLGGRTAFSVAFPEFGVPGWPSPPQPLVVVMVDSYHWDDAAILEALEVFSDSPFPVEGARYHQFAGEPPAKIVFELLTNYATIPPAILAAYLVESVRLLLGRRKKRRADTAKAVADETASDVKKPEAQPLQPQRKVTELPESLSVQSPPDDSSESGNSIPTKITLEFCADRRLASLEVDGSESSERLVEAVIRALADVTPPVGDQGTAE
jgi:hypothetical protein